MCTKYLPPGSKWLIYTYLLLFHAFTKLTLFCIWCKWHKINFYLMCQCPKTRVGCGFIRVILLLDDGGSTWIILSSFSLFIEKIWSWFFGEKFCMQRFFWNVFCCCCYYFFIRRIFSGEKIVVKNFVVKSNTK